MTLPTQLQPQLQVGPAGAAHSLDTKRRLVFLDGLRGLAILSVFFFHAFARWPELVPYGDAYANLAPFKYGLFGVRLFFMISGFVILMTLDKCTNFAEFMVRRWLRLFPAMLIATLVLFATAPLFPERPGGLPTLRDLLPGLSLIDTMFGYTCWGRTRQSWNGRSGPCLPRSNSISSSARPISSWAARAPS